MPWELVDAQGNRYRLPSSVWPERLHVGGSPRVRFVRGYGSEQWFTVQDGIREPEPIDLVGVLQTDRGEVTIQALLDQLDAAAASAVKLVHLDNYGVPIRQLPLLGALPITTEPDGVDGTFLRVTVPLVPGQADWEAPDESSGPVPIAYEYEVFTASGTWDWGAAGQPAEVDVLVLAGGGGGGSRQEGGGGGAGGLVIASGVAVAGNVTVTVGGGGAGGSAAAGEQGQDGQSSSFGAVTATGGGGGGAAFTDNPLCVGRNGGSGGGGGRSGNATYRVGGDGTAGQGGNGGPGGSVSGGGGGGAGGNGTAGGNSSSSGGAGGPGVSLADLGWAPAVALGAPSQVAGGGGGANGGSATHGGGAGSVGTGSAQAGTANTGGGGGGGGRSPGSGGVSNAAGGAGGSGLVIVRWVRP